MTDSISSSASRPDFMVTLGLLPPYSAEDVQQAYQEKLKKLKTGSPQFTELQQAYDKAKAYVELHADRRGWIATRMEEYLETQQVIDRLQDFGAVVETDAVDWLEKSLGDFFELTTEIKSVRLENSANGDEVVEYMASVHERLLALERVELPGCMISDAAVRQLSTFRGLEHVDLSRTPISWEALHIVEWLPQLKTLEVTGTPINWWTRRKALAKLRKRRRLADAHAALHPANLQKSSS